MLTSLMRRAVAAAFLLSLWLILPAAAAAEALSVDIYGPGQGKLRTAMAQPLGPNAAVSAPPQAAQLQQMIEKNLRYMPFLEQIPSETILGGDRLAGYTRENIDFKRFQLAETDLLITTGWTNPTAGGPNSIEIRAYEVYTSHLLVGKAYSDITPDKLQLVADMFCSALMEALTGRGEFFRSVLAFVKKGGPQDKQIWTMRPTGRELTQITKIKGMCMSPDWSRDTRYIVFSIVGERYHSLGLWDRRSGQVRTINYPGYTVIGPVFTPDNKVIVSMSSGNNSEIFQLNYIFKVEKELVKDWSIDVSPSLDASGRKMAFVSTRQGAPHVFVMDLGSGAITRVTYSGSYNQDPSLSPDGDLVVFSRQTSSGHRIFVLDIKTGAEKQISFGPGNDEQPSFAPDGYFVAFSSNRNGAYRLFLTTRHGDPAIPLETGSGDATAPAWGLLPQ